MLELLSYLKSQDAYELLLVINYHIVDYPSFTALDVPYKILGKKRNHKDPKLFFQFYQICKDFKPDIIHTWGGMQAFYSIPASLLKRIPLVNSQITNAPPKIEKFAFINLVNRINFKFSTVILSNSLAGIQAYNPPRKKSQVIYNGVNPDRFINLPAPKDVKGNYGITTPYAVVMVGSFSKKKDFGQFYKVAKYVIRQRDDITFIGAGGPEKDATEFERLTEFTKNNPRILFPGRIDDVEALVNACDVGVLFSPNGEGISNAILEYLALSKPVIANDAGGTRELVRHKENGYLVNNESTQQIADMILGLINDPDKCNSFGQKGKELIDHQFTLLEMGSAFEELYREILSR